MTRLMRQIGLKILWLFGIVLVWISFALADVALATNGELGAWRSAGTNTNYKYVAATVYAKGRIFLIGGQQNNASTEVCSADVSSAGIVSNWRSEASLNAARTDVRAVTDGRFIWVVGGANVDPKYKTVERAAINSDGTLGKWVNETNQMNASRCGQGLVIAQDRIYAFGGDDNGDGRLNSVESASIQGDGSLGSWRYENSLTTTRYATLGVYAKGCIYAINGAGGSSAFNDLYSVERAKVNDDGTLSTWVDCGRNTAINHQHGGAAYIGGYLYALGSNGNYMDNTAIVEKAKVNDDGTIGSWVRVEDLNRAMGGYCNTLVCGNNLLVLDGRSSDIEVNTPYIESYTGLGDINVPILTSSVTIDGNIGSSEWSDAWHTSETLLSNDGTASGIFTFYLKHGGGFLYIGVKTPLADGWDSKCDIGIDAENDNLPQGQLSSPYRDIVIGQGGVNAWSGYNLRQALMPDGTEPDIDRWSSNRSDGTLSAVKDNCGMNYEFKIPFSSLHASVTAGSTINLEFMNMGADSSHGTEFRYPGSFTTQSYADTDMYQWMPHWSKLYLKTTNDPTPPMVQSIDAEDSYQLVANDGSLIVDVPTGAFSQKTDLSIVTTSAFDSSGWNGATMVRGRYLVFAKTAGNTLVVQPDDFMTISFTYDYSEIGGQQNEDKMQIYYSEDDKGADGLKTVTSWHPIKSTVLPSKKRVVCRVRHFTILSLIVDLSAPSFKWRNPAAGKYLKGWYTVGGTVDDLAGIDGTLFRIDSGSWLTVGSTAFSRKVDTALYKDGAHRFSVKAYDGVANAALLSRTIYIDNYKPGVKLYPTTYSRSALSKKPYLRFLLTERFATQVKVKKAAILSRNSSIVKKLVTGIWKNASYPYKANSLIWNGKKEDGRSAALGKYFLSLTLQDKAGNVTTAKLAFSLAK